MSEYLHKYSELIKFLSDEELNPYQRDYYIRQFNDSFFGNSNKYIDKNDNFAYIKQLPNENKTSAIIENILFFMMKYNSFYERTGISFFDFLYMDPSTSELIQNTWSELIKPEEKQQEDILKLQKELDKAKNTLMHK